MPICVLVRHGQSTSNLAGTLAGWSPGVDLTEAGRTQAQAAGAVLRAASVSAIFSSPVARCQQTAAELGLGLEVTHDDDLGECHYGAWTGRDLKELAQEPLWRTVQDDPAAARFPASEEFAAESLQEMSDRLVAAIARHDAAVSAEYGDDAVWVAVSHGDPIKAVLAQASGAGVGALQNHHVDPGSLSIVRYHKERSVVLATNVRDCDLAALVQATRATPPGDVAIGGGAG